MMVIYLGLALLFISALPIQGEQQENLTRLWLDDIFPSDSENNIHVIFPGTKWCGDGNVAANYNDLGELKETDKCCRTHDHCDKTIEAWKSKFGLKNNTPFTK